VGWACIMMRLENRDTTKFNWPVSDLAEERRCSREIRDSGIQNYWLCPLVQEDAISWKCRIWGTVAEMCALIGKPTIVRLACSGNLVETDAARFGNFLEVTTLLRAQTRAICIWMAVLTKSVSIVFN
jgi:hypothetical protein